jgi:predicted transcriptional regulator
VAGIREGAAELDRGESITADELLKRIPQWAKTSK